jgi:serine/threonine protein kinase
MLQERGAAMEISRMEDRKPANEQLGKYRRVATLGQGGMGTVFLAFAHGVGQFRKLLVVKELLPELTGKEGFIEMFLDEARLAARLDHPNVVQTFEVGHEGGRYFLAMEYLDGQPLSALIERMRERGGLPLPVHLQILSEVLAGLQYAHELCDYDGRPLAVVHRDISPHNVFITYHGQVKIVDFGVAKAANASALTHPGVFKGKFGYAAPEQILGGPVDARADVFSVGVMLWQAIAGRRFAEPTPTP